MSFKINNKTKAVLETLNHGNPFTINASQLTSASFYVGLKDLARKENVLDRTLSEYSTARMHNDKVDPALLVEVTRELLEVKFCLGLFAIGYSSPDLFEVNEDTTAQEIYHQLRAKQNELSPQAQAKFKGAQFTLDKSRDVLGQILKGLGAINRTAYNATATAVRFASKQGGRLLNKLATKVAAATAQK